MRLILSTSYIYRVYKLICLLTMKIRNIMGSGPSVLARPNSKSNFELTAALRLNISHHRTASPSSYKSWTSTSSDNADLYIPGQSPSAGLAEDRNAYDITVKLFYLPHVPPNQRCQHTRDAIAFVLKELQVENINLLIISFPGITFDADDESDDSLDGSSAPTTPSLNDLAGEFDAPEHMDSIMRTWRTLEELHDSGVILKLGLSEFGTQRLTKVLSEARVPPSVDQINVRDCCVVPRPLIVFAKEKKIELLTHSDCTDILPSGTLREILGPGEKGCGVLAATATAIEGEIVTEKTPAESDGLQGEVSPLWVVKYTAVVTNRGVVENKGYIAAASLS
jgi:glutamate--cysteine ligase regulatory subunit